MNNKITNLKMVGWIIQNGRRNKWSLYKLTVTPFRGKRLFVYFFIFFFLTFLIFTYMRFSMVHGFLRLLWIELENLSFKVLYYKAWEFWVDWPRISVLPPIHCTYCTPWCNYKPTKKNHSTSTCYILPSL